MISTDANKDPIYTNKIPLSWQMITNVSMLYVLQLNWKCISIHLEKNMQK